ncbi:MAG: AMP-binding protein [Acidobacteria bacterium]|nr:AMP-binding protein [Acidobacteriota bacterium]
MSALIYTDHFEEIAGLFSHRVAFRSKGPDGYRTMTYGEVRRQVQDVARGLVALGLERGARVAVLSENRPEWVIAYLGAYFAGLTAVPLDTQISPAEWRRLLDDSESQVVFVSGLLISRLREALPESFPADRLICLDPTGGDSGGQAELRGFMEWAHSLEPRPTLPQRAPDDVVVIIYTSGTTGQPKGVMLTMDNIVAEVTSALEAVHADEEDNLLCLLPLQHVLASVINVLIPLWLGAQVTFADTLKRSEILAALREAGVTILVTVPQFFYLFHDRIQDELARSGFLARKAFRGLLKLNGLARRRLKINLGRIFFRKVHRNFGSRLRLFVSGGSPFDPKVAQAFHDMGFTILQGYGLTETSGAATLTRVKENVIGSVGKPLKGVDVEILDRDDVGIGEVLIRGPIVMKGYYRNPAATQEAISDGWLRSGDLGRVDSLGNLFITGRKKEVIVLPSGKNIYPDEIESHYLQCPCIQEMAVLGIAEGESRDRGERLHAVIVPNFDYLKQQKIANTREIMHFEIGRLSGQLPKYKRLMSYQIQKEPLPRTTSRKVKRLELKRLIEAGALKGMAPAEGVRESSAGDRELIGSPVGQEVMRCLREDFRRESIGPGMNLELDLGFDSMERVELLASLEQSLGLSLPPDFGAEIFTVRDLVVRLEHEARAGGSAGGVSRESWKTILSREALEKEGDWRIRFAGLGAGLVKYVGLRALFVLLKVSCRMEVRGKENLPRDGPFLICPNHLSYLDPFAVMSVLPHRIFRKVFFVGASEYFTTWYMKVLARLANIVPVDPDGHLLQAMKVGAYGLRQGRILCIFPEGMRSFDGELKEFKKGAAILSQEVQVPIVPVGVVGTFEVWPRDTLRIRPHKIKLAFGPPLFPAASESSPYQAVTDRLREQVARLTLS